MRRTEETFWGNFDLSFRYTFIWSGGHLSFQIKYAILSESSFGDSFFVNSLVDATKSIKEKFGLIVDVKNIQGRTCAYIPDFEISYFSKPRD